MIQNNETVRSQMKPLLNSFIKVIARMFPKLFPEIAIYDKMRLEELAMILDIKLEGGADRELIRQTKQTASLQHATTISISAASSFEGSDLQRDIFQMCERIKERKKVLQLEAELPAKPPVVVPVKVKSIKHTHCQYGGCQPPKKLTGKQRMYCCIGHKNKVLNPKRSQ